MAHGFGRVRTDIRSRSTQRHQHGRALLSHKKTPPKSPHRRAKHEQQALSTYL